MSHRLRRFGHVKVVAIAALAAAMSGGVAYAVTAIPGPDGEIQGCYANATGQLRVVASAEECRSSETALRWNQQGPKGDDGAPAPADGGAVVFGRVLANGTRCPLGYPSGIAEGAEGECSPAAATAARGMPVPAAKRLQNLRATMAQPRDVHTTLWLVTPDLVVRSCTIPEGGTSCEQPAKSPVIPAGAPLAAIVTYNDAEGSASSVSFSYELVNP